MPRWFPLPVQASAHAAATDAIIIAAHVLIAALFAGWLGYFVYVLIRFRRRRQPRADYRGTSGHASRAGEAAVVIAEAILLIGFALPAWARRSDPPPPDATVVQVVAEQFVWNVRYPGPDGIFDTPDDVVILNELELPDDKPVLIYLSSNDVIHSLSLPQMRVKQDAIPGLRTPVWFQPTRDTPDGEQWEINCSQLCGLGHYRMRALYRVVPRPAFEAWLRDAAAAR